MTGRNTALESDKQLTESQMDPYSLHRLWNNGVYSLLYIVHLELYRIHPISSQFSVLNVCMAVVAIAIF